MKSRAFLPSFLTLEQRLPLDAGGDSTNGDINFNKNNPPPTLGTGTQSVSGLGLGAVLDKPATPAPIAVGDFPPLDNTNLNT